MVTITDHVHSLQRQSAEALTDELYYVDALNERLIDADTQLINALQRTVSDHERRRYDAVALIATLAQRIGHLPAIHQPPPLPVDDDAQSLQVDDVINDYVRSIREAL